MCVSTTMSWTPFGIRPMAATVSSAPRNGPTAPTAQCDQDAPEAAGARPGLPSSSGNTPEKHQEQKWPGSRGSRDVAVVGDGDGAFEKGAMDSIHGWRSAPTPSTILSEVDLPT